MIRDLGVVLFRIISVALLPAFIVGFGIYGARVWLWNWANRDPMSGTWEFVIQKEDS